MNDSSKTKLELIKELEVLRQRVIELEEVEARRLRIEEAFREGGDLYRKIIDACPDPIVIYDLEGKLIAANKQALYTYGVSTVADYLEKVKTIFDVLTDEGRVYAENRLRKILMDGSGSPSEYVVKLNNGKVITAELHTSVIWSADGAPRAFITITRDISKRKQLEEELQKSEERYRTVLEEIDEGYFENDLQGNLTFVNDAMCRNLGYTREELIGMNYRHYNDDIVVKKVLEAFTDIYRTGKPSKRYEAVFVTKDGKKHFSEASGSLMRDAKGTPVGFRGVARNIDDRRLAEDALRRSEERYRLIAENMGELITVTDMNLCFIYISPSIARTHGYTVEEAMNMSLENFMTPESMQKLLTVFEEEMTLEASGRADPGRIRVLEVEEYKKDGSTIWLETSISGIHDQDGNLVSILTVNRDITRRKQVEEKLRASEEQLRRISDAAKDAILMINPQGLITHWNPAAEKILGYSAEEALGQNLHDLLAPERYIEDHKTAFSVFQGNGRGNVVGRTIELFAKRRDGQEIPVEMSLSAIEPKRGVVWSGDHS